MLNKKQKIALANDAFARVVGRSAADLEGQDVSEFDWRPLTGELTSNDYPWTRAIRDEHAETGTILDLHTQEARRRTLLINAAPIVADDRTCRGAIASFDDVTILRDKEQRLRKAIARLRESQAKIRQQNEKLRETANKDPLTSCLNRRAFLDLFETRWTRSIQWQRPLSCLMIDIDHFKYINDQFGHRRGDRVLRMVAANLMSLVCQTAAVCRYGGDEFCVLLPDLDVTDACQEAEKLRTAIMSEEAPGVWLTGSFGVSSLSLGPRQASELLDQADCALYGAKRLGRNRVVRWDQVPNEAKLDKSAQTPEDMLSLETVAQAIPFHTVTSLLSALAYRHPDSAEHSRRVADLAVDTARGLMPHGQCYVLQIAALLHDIGKIGVPDAILLKPGPLSEEEWCVMHAHGQMGMNIVSAAFACEELTEMVSGCHASYDNHADAADLSKSRGLPLGARIISIADAFDAMVSDRVYRKAISRENAFAELRRGAGTQFDPDLVERFIDVVSVRDSFRMPAETSMSKQAALRIGLEIERLADALDKRSVDEVMEMARHLKHTAHELGIVEIARVAAELETCCGSDPELVEVVQCTSDLLNLCRTTQAAMATGAGVSAAITQGIVLT